METGNSHDALRGFLVTVTAEANASEISISRSIKKDEASSRRAGPMGPPLTSGSSAKTNWVILVMAVGRPV